MASISRSERSSLTWLEVEAARPEVGAVRPESEPVTWRALGMAARIVIAIHLLPALAAVALLSLIGIAVLGSNRILQTWTRTSVQ